MDCPITLERMVDPVVAADGHTYERHAIEHWLSERSSSPLTGAPLYDPKVRPNHTLRKLMTEVEFYRHIALDGPPDDLYPEPYHPRSDVLLRRQADGWRAVALTSAALTLCSIVSNHAPPSSAPGLLSLLVAVALCVTGLVSEDERAALVLVLAGAPFACLSFGVGVACADRGDASGAILLSRCLLLAGLLFCCLGARLTRG